METMDWLISALVVALSVAGTNAFVCPSTNGAGRSPTTVGHEGCRPSREQQ